MAWGSPQVPNDAHDWSRILARATGAKLSTCALLVLGLSLGLAVLGELLERLTPEQLARQGLRARARAGALFRAICPRCVNPAWLDVERTAHDSVGCFCGYVSNSSLHSVFVERIELTWHRPGSEVSHAHGRRELCTTELPAVVVIVPTLVFGRLRATDQVRFRVVGSLARTSTAAAGSDGKVIKQGWLRPLTAST